VRSFVVTRACTFGGCHLEWASVAVACWFFLVFWSIGGVVCTVRHCEVWWSTNVYDIIAQDDTVHSAFVQ